MKNYQSFLSEQKAAANRSQENAMAGLGGGNLDGHDTVIADAGNVNILMPDMIYNWTDMILNLPELNITYNHQQLIAILKGMSEREKRKVAGYVNSLKNFRSKETIGLLAQSLKKADLSAGTFIPSRHAQWGR